MGPFSSLKHKSASVKYQELNSATYTLDIDASSKKKTKCGKCLKRIVSCTGWLILGCLFAAAALCMYKTVSGYLKDDSSSTISVQADQCNIDENNRFDCWPEKDGATQKSCEDRGCCWKPSSAPNTAPYCFFPTNFSGYNATELLFHGSGINATLRRTNTSFMPKDVMELKVNVEYHSETMLRMKIYDPNSARYEVPLKVPTGGKIINDPQYEVKIGSSPFGIAVQRKSTGATVFDTIDTAPLIFADQYLQMATKLSTKYLYGLGEHRNNFLQDLSTWRRLVFWNADDVPKVDNNGYGTHPFFLNLENATGSGVPSAHGVFLLNSNAGEVALQPYGAKQSGAVTFRQLGGILDFFIILGQDPLSVVTQLPNILGRPFMPPFWSLGFHLCRWGYNSSAQLQKVLERNRKAEMPYVALQPYGSSQTGAITYRMLGGVLDFFIVLGEDPVSVVTQYTSVIGRPYLPPFWSLGFHICKYGIHTDKDLQNMVNRNRAGNMPYDVQWTDIDYMEGRRDWTYDKTRFGDLPNIVKDLHDNKQRYVLMADPAIASDQPAGQYPPFDDGKKLDVFVKNASGDILIGEVWPGPTAFPDFFHPQAVGYWYHQAYNFHTQLPFDGLWIDMNEPSSFVDGSSAGCTNSSLDNPPYVPPSIDRGTLYAKTVCPSAKQHLSSHYNLHNMYGWSQANVTRKVLELIYISKRSLMITRSSFPGSGTLTGHWLGDNESTFSDLFYSIPGILNFNLFGIPQIGADICGFRGVTTPELCTRWHQLGAFYPFMRNHADIKSPDQDPGSFQKPYQDYIRSALELRYRLLAVLYTGFFRASLNGLPIVRPLFFMYPGTESIDKQFMWNDQLLISPVVDQGATSVKAYIPDDVWYDFFNGTVMSSKGKEVDLAAPLDHINVHVRGGSILPLLPVTQRTDDSRKQKFELLVAFDTNGNASGELIWDDGDSIDSIYAQKYSIISFSMEKSTTLTTSVTHSGYKPSEGIKLGSITFYGVTKAPSSVTVNGKTATFDYNKDAQILTVKNLDEDLLQTVTVKLN